MIAVKPGVGAGTGIRRNLSLLLVACFVMDGLVVTGCSGMDARRREPLGLEAGPGPASSGGAGVQSSNIQTHSLVSYEVADILASVRDICGHRGGTVNDEEGGTPFGFEDESDDEPEDLDPADLCQLVMESTGGEEVWRESQSTIEGGKSSLIVNATPLLHSEVRGFLSDLRR